MKRVNNLQQKQFGCFFLIFLCSLLPLHASCSEKAVLKAKDLKTLFWGGRTYPGGILVTKHIQTYLEKRWNLERVKKFTSQKEIIAFPVDGEKGFWGTHMLHGQLHLNSKSEFSEIQWSALLENGMPMRFLIRKPGLILECGRFSTKDLSDQEFERYVSYRIEMANRHEYPKCDASSVPR